MTIISKSFFEHQQILADSVSLLSDSIDLLADLICETLARGSCIFWCGNGGSAADCQHLASEFVGRFKLDRKPLRSIALTTDCSALTAIANDYNYDTIFSRQIEAISRPGDLLIAISTSGNSINIVQALSTARNLGLQTAALLGKGGGRASGICDFPIIVPASDTARIQEVHIFIGHCLCEIVDSKLFIQN